MFFEDFTPSMHRHWTQTCVGTGSLAVEHATLRMSMQPVPQGRYSDAQIDDYGTLTRANFPWRAPLRMEVRARSALSAAGPGSTVESPNILRGTAGFGFWNHPFSVRGDVLMLPEAIWFFYASPPSDMSLVPGVPGWGWKAQVVHTMRPGAILATIPTALATGWGLVTHRTQAAGRWLQRLSGAHEQLLSIEMTTWHTYTLEWRQKEATFWVDGIQVLSVADPPTRPLGFVAWLDNQYAIATPRGVLRFGAVASEAQWLEIASIRIEPL